MGIPEEDRAGEQHPYGDYGRVSADGKYAFEWTPFTPAVIAWSNAEGHLRTARDRLVDARRLSGFAIPGLEPQHDQYVEALKVHADDVHAAAVEAEKVIQVLQAANAAYAVAADASREEYRLLTAVVDNAMVQQGRAPRPASERAGGV